jgi:hypothetical protein
MVQSQPGQTVHPISRPYPEKPFTKIGLVEWLKAKALSSSPSAKGGKNKTKQAWSGSMGQRLASQTLFTEEDTDRVVLRSHSCARRSKTGLESFLQHPLGIFPPFLVVGQVPFWLKPGPTRFPVPLPPNNILTAAWLR